MSLLLFILFASLSFSVNSQNVINKNTLKKQCSFNTIKNVEFVVSEYENNPSKFKYVYNYKNEIEDDENIVLYFNSDVCSFMCDKYKKIAFKDSENDYYKIKNIIVKNNDYNENLDNCVQLNDNVLIDYDMCLVDSNFIVSSTTSTTTTTTDGVTTTTTAGVTTTTTDGVTTILTLSNETNVELPVQESMSSSSDDNNVNSSQQIGIIVGCVVGVCLFIILVALFIVKKRRTDSVKVQENIHFNNIYDSNLSFQSSVKQEESVQYECPVPLNEDKYENTHCQSPDYESPQPQNSDYENTQYYSVINKNNSDTIYGTEEQEQEHEQEQEQEQDYDNPKFMQNKVNKNTKLHDHINNFATKNDINIEDE